MQDNFTLKKVAGKELIYDGTDDGFYKNYVLNLKNGDTIEFSTENIRKLKSLENRDYLNKIISSCTGVYNCDVIPELSKYKNEDDLSVYFNETPEYIAIISLGESQPGRYKIYQEGIFKKLTISL